MIDATSNAPAVVVARGLTKRYRRKTALDNVYFRIGAGRIVGLIGPNGAGKTTALKAMLGLIPFEGELSVLGLAPRTQRDALMQDVSFIADVPILPRWISLREAAEFVGNLSPRFDRARFDRFLAKTSLRPEQRVSELSRGMVVLFHLALVMAIDARLLVLDEPTLGLDILHRKQFYQTLLEDFFDEGKTILVTTHQVEEIEHILTDVLFIQDGRIVIDASMDALGARFVEVLVHDGHADEARRMAPLDERSLPFGRTVMIFDRERLDDASAGRIATLGETRIPGLADLFVATMKGAQS